MVGAAYRPDWSVEHIIAETQEQLQRISGTKYLRSDMGDIFPLVRERLRAGQEVLFSGTGCQVAGLRAFLRKNHPNLLTVNIACFGAPSPSVWINHLTQLRKRYCLGDIQHINFRKKDSRSDLNLEIRGAQNTYTAQVYEDPLGWGLCKGIINHPACADCRFKNAACGSDISLGDARGVEQADATLEPEKGLSLAICHTEKGRNALGAIAEKCSIFRPMPCSVMSNNKGFCTYSYPNTSVQARTRFFARYNRFSNARMLLMLEKLRPRAFVRWLIRDILLSRRLRLLQRGSSAQ